MSSSEYLSSLDQVDDDGALLEDWEIHLQRLKVLRSDIRE